jgi:hypothetical protein
LTIEKGVAQFEPFTKKVPCFLHFNGMSYMDLEHDYLHLPDNTLGFSYNKVYDRTFRTILLSKVLTSNYPVACTLTGRGSTY